MDEIEKTIDAAIKFWRDVCHIRGERHIAERLEPYIKEALAEPGSALHRFIVGSPKHIDFYLDYASKSESARLKMLRQSRKNKGFNDAAWFLISGMQLIAEAYKEEGLSATEQERRVEKAFAEELSNISLKELISRPREGRKWLRIDMRSLLSSLRLPPGSVAGKDRRLKWILDGRLMSKIDGISLYEQDLKAALWEVSKGKHLDEFTKMLAARGDTAKQLATLRRIFSGQERKLVRATLIRTLRKTIEELDDIRQEMRNLERRYAEVTLDEDVVPIEVPEYRNAQEAFLSMIEGRVDIGRLDTRSLNLLTDELNRIRLGMTRKKYYGKNEEDRIKQQFKRLCDRLREESK